VLLYKNIRGGVKQQLYRGSPESLRQLLQYMEHTTKENAATEELRTLEEGICRGRTEGKAAA
jgi:hypothetical protein